VRVWQAGGEAACLPKKAPLPPGRKKSFLPLEK